MSNLLKTRNEVYSEMKALMSLENRSEGDFAKYNELESKYQSLTKQIETEVRFDAIKNSMNEVLDKRAVSGNSKASDEEYRSAFLHYVRTGDATEVRQLNSFSTSEGGANVPVVLLNQLQRSIAQNSVMRRIGARTITTTSTTDLPIVSTRVTALFKDQNPSASYASTDPVFGKVTLSAYKATALIKMSQELLEDSATDVESTLMHEIGVGLGDLEEKSFVSGSGTAEPLGILRTTTAGGNSVLTQNLGASTGSALLDNMIAAYYKMSGNKRQDACWIVGDALASQMRQLKSVAGTGGYLWEVSVQAGAPDRFIGLPVYSTFAAPTTWAAGATNAVGALLYPQHYVIGDRGATSVTMLRERYADEGNVAWIAHKRFDAVLTDGTSLVKLYANLA